MSGDDLKVIWGGGVVVLGVFTHMWRRLVAAKAHTDPAVAEDVPALRLQLFYVALMAAVVTVAMKVVGMLFIIALAIIPAAARSISRTPVSKRFWRAALRSRDRR